ncbi:uncharacterized protein TNCV_2250421 [Trichonephila clavipes]|nr:uncharacterized protein TNCV_2250421 [Trichonephila clavipes]
MLDLLFLSKTAFRNQELKIQQAASIVSIESMKNAATEVKKLKNSPLESISYCAVSMDGTWQKRGYSSHNGCISCISIDTGKILDIEIMSHFCRICSKKAKVPDAASNAHVCCNHMGSDSTMETVRAYRIFERLENHRKLQYTDYYGDGDFKAYESIKNMYAPNTVNKLECIGHVQKRSEYWKLIEPFWEYCTELWEMSLCERNEHVFNLIATAGSDVVQSGRPIFDDFFQHLWPYIGNNTANVVFQMVKRLWLIRIDQ